jgi:hypothetical protein
MPFICLAWANIVGPPCRITFASRSITCMKQTKWNTSTRKVIDILSEWTNMTEFRAAHCLLNYTYDCNDIIDISTSQRLSYARSTRREVGVNYVY